jgi:hypothetical protein
MPTLLQSALPLSFVAADNHHSAYSNRSHSQSQMTNFGHIALLTLFGVVCAAWIIAQTPTYSAAEAAKHIGEIATITDRVDGVHQSGKGNIFLNMGGKYPNQAFAAWIPSANVAQFSNPQQYAGKTVAVSGTLYGVEKWGQI